jgi:tryptophanyl-tRNA synthetase
MKQIALTGIKPTGTPHIGNYFGAIKPALELANSFDAFYFIADYHALTTVRDQATLNRLCYEVTATWLAAGLDPEKVVFYRQSDIPEVFELNWILACFTPKGLLNRAHAYKAAADENIKAERPQDEGINAGLYNYPVLMAADILLFRSNVVPVGFDQKQHVEIARDIAIFFNNTYGGGLTIPEERISEEVMTVPGIDGRKMSKNYNNTLPIFLASKELRKKVMQIVTDSRPPEEPKNPDECNVFNIYRLFASPAMIEATRKRYEQGGIGYGEMKQELFQLLDENFRDLRDTYNELLSDKDHLDRVLRQGAEKARSIAVPVMREIRQRIGISRPG